MRIRHAVALIALIGLSLAVVRAQAPTPPAGGQGASMKGVVFKGKVPVSKDTIKVTLPKPVEFDLGNSLHVMVLEDHRLPQVAFQLVIPGAGGYFDPPDMPGLASFTAALMREGTATKTSAQISQQLETMAANVGAGTGMSDETAFVNGSCLTENTDAVLALAADIVLNPSFAEEELARYKTRTKAGLMAQRSSPSFLSVEMVNRVLYGTHPGGRTAPTAEAVDKATRPVLAEFHRTHYVPDHAVIGIVGDVTAADARKKIEAAFGTWKKAGTPTPVVQDPGPLGPATVYVVNRPGSVQTAVAVATQAIARTSADYDTVRLLNEIIGGGPTGRLFLNLREDKGWTYGAYSAISATQFRGDWVARAEVRTDVTEGAVRETLQEIATTRDQLIPDAALQDKKRLLVAGFALSLESPATILNNHIQRWLYKLPMGYWDTYTDRVMAVSAAGLQAAARKYLDPSRLQIVVVGDGKQIGEVMKKFGTVETYDTEGKKITQ
jgi:zinc protease